MHGDAWNCIVSSGQKLSADAEYQHSKGSLNSRRQVPDFKGRVRDTRESPRRAIYAHVPIIAGSGTGIEPQLHLARNSFVSERRENFVREPLGAPITCPIGGHPPPIPCCNSMPCPGNCGSLPAGRSVQSRSLRPERVPLQLKNPGTNADRIKSNLNPES